MTTPPERNRDEDFPEQLEPQPEDDEGPDFGPHDEELHGRPWIGEFEDDEDDCDPTSKTGRGGLRG